MQADDIVKFSSIAEQKAALLNTCGVASATYIDNAEKAANAASWYDNPAYVFCRYLANDADYLTPSNVKQYCKDEADNELSKFSKKATLLAGLVGAGTLGILFL